jgi:hypothetical protein
MTQTIITTTFPIYTHGNPDAAMTITAEFVPGHDAAIIDGVPIECAAIPEFEIESVIVDGIEIDGIIDDEFAEHFWHFDHNRKTYVRHNRGTLMAEINYYLSCEL